MFGFSKPTPPKRERTRNPAEFGIFGLSNDVSGLGDDVDVASDSDDDALEAELAAITAGMGGARKAKPKPNTKGIVAPQELDAMVAASLRDVGSDDDDASDDDDDDSDLLDELSAITGGAVGYDDGGSKEDAGRKAKPPAAPPRKSSSDEELVGLLKTRVAMYTQAEEGAKKAGDSGKARRFNRGLKTLKDQLRLAEAGKPVDQSEIPPEVSVKMTAPPKDATDDTSKPATAPVRPAPPPPSMVTPSTPDEPGPSRSAPPVPPRREAKPPPMPAPVLQDEIAKENPKLTLLNERKQLYKQAALNAKKAGNNEQAMAYVKVLKQFDVVIRAMENGEEVDLSKMPPPPSGLNTAQTSQPTVPSVDKARQEEMVQKEAEVPSPSVPISNVEQPAEEDEEDEENLIQASTVQEALEQRLEKYISVEKAAKEEGNSSKARRMGRIVKQYQDALKMHKAGKPIPIDELPTPPGYGPIPVNGPPKPPVPAVAKKPVPSIPQQPPVASPPVPTAEPVPGPSKSAPKPVTQFDKQLNLLLERHREYKQAAIEAKKAGDLDEAKECLRVFKGLEKLIEVARAGGRVDLTTVPISPSKRNALESSFTIVNSEDCDQPGGDNEQAGSTDPGVDGETRVRLEEQLSKQLIICRNTRDHHRAMGDIAGMNKFENLALNVQKDLDLVRLTHRQGLALPKFHYEKLQFNVVKCHTDLSDNEVEICVVRGINYNVPNPKDVDTYVKFEFPYPQEDPLKGRTNIVKDTHSPEYNYQQTFEIQRSQRNCQRVFKRHALKCEVFSKGCCCHGASTGLFSCFSGFLRSDVLIGTVTVKLQALETQIEIHDSFPLMDGRRTVGGKLEVKIRVRNPILTKQIEQINERWVVLDS